MDPFTRSAEPLAGSGEDRYAPRAAEQRFGESRGKVHQMLAIVEDDENAMILDGDGDLIDWILLEVDIEPQSRSSGRRRLCLILDRGKVYEGNRVEGRA